MHSHLEQDGVLCRRLLDGDAPDAHCGDCGANCADRADGSCGCCDANCEGRGGNYGDSGEDCDSVGTDRGARTSPYIADNGS